MKIFGFALLVSLLVCCFTEQIEMTFEEFAVHFQKSYVND